MTSAAGRRLRAAGALAVVAFSPVPLGTGRVEGLEWAVVGAENVVRVML
jgi:hypothetical protein